MVMAGGAVAEACRQLGERVAAIGAALLQVSAADVVVADGTVRRRDTRLFGHHRRCRAHLVSRAAEPAARCRQGRSRDHGGLSSRSRHRHAFLCLPRRRGAGRYRDRRRRAGGLCDRRGRRQAGEPDDRRRPGDGRPGAGHRHGALRGDAVRQRRPAARGDPRRLSAARHDRRARRAARPYGDARAPGRPSARRASARAARSARRARS